MLDVKSGAGAFMKTLDDSRALARAMVDIGTRAGRNVRAVLTDMDTPLGHMAGNSLEVQEAIATLNGTGPADLTELCVTLAAEVLLAAGQAADPAQARERAARALQDGSALAKLEAFVTAQGGDGSLVRNPEGLDVAPGRAEITAPQGGYIQRLDALSVGRAVLALGGGRERKGDPVDVGVGVETVRKPGEQVEEGDVIYRLYHRDGKGLERAQELLREGIELSGTPPEVKPLILDRVQ